MYFRILNTTCHYVRSSIDITALLKCDFDVVKVCVYLGKNSFPHRLWHTYTDLDADYKEFKLVFSEIYEHGSYNVKFVAYGPAGNTKETTEYQFLVDPELIDASETKSNVNNSPLHSRKGETKYGSSMFHEDHHVEEMNEYIKNQSGCSRIETNKLFWDYSCGKTLLALTGLPEQALNNIDGYSLRCDTNLLEDLLNTFKRFSPIVLKLNDYYGIKSGSTDKEEIFAGVITFIHNLSLPDYEQFSIAVNNLLDSEGYLDLAHDDDSFKKIFFDWYTTWIFLCELYYNEKLPSDHDTISIGAYPETKIAACVESIIRQAATAYSAIFESNLKTVRYTANYYLNDGLSYMELFQEGTIGLMRAIKLYSALQGVNFIAYSTTWIRQHILRFIQDERRIIRFPVHMSEEIEKAERTQYVGECEIDREINKLDLHKWTPELAESKALNYLYSFISLDRLHDFAVLSDDADYQNVSVVQHEKLTYDMHQEIEDNYYIGYIRQYLELLPPRSAFIIVRRLGLSTPIQTLEEIASQLNLTRERVRQIEKEGFKLLQQMAKSVFIARDNIKKNDQNKKIQFKEGLFDFSARIGRSITPGETSSSDNDVGSFPRTTASPKLITNNDSGIQKMQYIFV